MPTIRITEKQDAYITVDVEVTEEQLAELRAMTPEQVDAWNTRAQAEGVDLDWVTSDFGEEFETVSVDVYTGDPGNPGETLWERS